MSETRIFIEQAILEVLGDEWLTIPQMAEKVGTKLGTAPEEIRDAVALCTGILTTQGKLENKIVPTKDGKNYYYMCRKRRKPKLF